MLGPQTANREKKIPPKSEFRLLGICSRAGRLDSVIVFFGIRYAVDQFSTLCILKEMTQGE